MGIIYPLNEIPKEEYMKRIKSIKEQALARARQKFLADVKDLVIRPLKPRDLGLASDEWTFNVSAGTNNVIDKTLDDKTMVVIFGIYNLSTNPQVNEVVFKTGSETIEDVYIEDMYLYDQPAAILDEPVVYTPSSRILIDVVAKGSNATEKLGFLGFVVEPAGRTISK